MSDDTPPKGMRQPPLMNRQAAMAWYEDHPETWTNTVGRCDRMAGFIDGWLMRTQMPDPRVPAGASARERVAIAMWADHAMRSIVPTRLSWASLDQWEKDMWRYRAGQALLALSTTRAVQVAEGVYLRDGGAYSEMVAAIGGLLDLLAVEAPKEASA